MGINTMRGVVESHLYTQQLANIQADPYLRDQMDAAVKGILSQDPAIGRRTAINGIWEIATDPVASMPRLLINYMFDSSAVTLLNVNVLGGAVP